MRVTLAITRGPHVGCEFTFEEHDNFIVGRSRDAHFRLPRKDRHFSRIHFMIEVDPPRCRLMDMGSTNGTYVNGSRVQSVELIDGDSIQGGNTVITASIEGQSDPQSSNQTEDHSEFALGLPATLIGARLPKTAVIQEDCETKLAGSPVEAVRQCAACMAHFRACTVAIAAGNAALCGKRHIKAQQMPQTIPGYTLIRELGRGAMGVVHLAAEDRGGLVAVKTIIPNGPVTKKDSRRFLREAEILRSLNHPNIVRFVDMGAADKQIYFAMEYVRGVNAASLVKDGPSPIPQAVTIACQVLEGREFAPQQGFVHRDVKPGNILATLDSDVKMADFGLARAYQNSPISGLTLTGQFGGTLAFMPPEQLTRYRDARPTADQYSLAASLYYLLPGFFVYDFPKSVDGKLLMLLQGTPVPIQLRRPDIPDELVEIIHRGLHKDPRKRFADGAQMRARLDAFTVRGQIGCGGEN